MLHPSTDPRWLASLSRSLSTRPLSRSVRARSASLSRPAARSSRCSSSLGNVRAPKVAAASTTASSKRSSSQPASGLTATNESSGQARDGVDRLGDETPDPLGPVRTDAGRVDGDLSARRSCGVLADGCAGIDGGGSAHTCLDGTGRTRGRDRVRQRTAGVQLGAHAVERRSPSPWMTAKVRPTDRATGTSHHAPGTASPGSGRSTSRARTTAWITVM